jgi:O-antigen/teichoic acid export membrane protein
MLLIKKIGSVISLTFITEMIVLIGGIISIRLAGQEFGTKGFGEYSIARRSMSLLAFPMLQGLGTSIPRYVALSYRKKKPINAKQISYFVTGFLLLAPFIFLFSLISFLTPTIISKLFFGDSFYTYYTLPILLVTIGLCFNRVVYGYLRGLLSMKIANLFHLLSIGITPSLSIYLSSNKPAICILLMGLIWLTISIITTGFLFIRDKELLKDIKISQIKNNMRDLFVYGLPRIPGEFALFGLSALPTFIIAHKSGVEEAGLFSFGIALMQLVGSLFSTVGIILLPHISRKRANNEWQEIKDCVKMALSYSIFTASIIVTAFQWLLPNIVLFWMGNEFLSAVSVSRWLLWGAIPYVIYSILRNPIDAITTYPYNSINIILIFISTFVICWFFYTSVKPQIVVFSNILCLSFMTIMSWKKGVKIEKEK